MDADVEIADRQGREAYRWLRAARLDTIPTFGRMRSELGEVARLSFLGRRFVFTFHPQDTEHLLVPAGSRFVKGRALQRARGLFGDGLLVSEGDLHKRQRQLAQPAFQPRRLAPYAAPMVRHAERAAQELLAGPRDLEVVMSSMTLDIASETMFGVQLDPRDVRRLAGAMHEVRVQFPNSLHPLAPLFDHLPLPRTIRARRAISTIQGIVDKVVDERRHAPDASERGDLLSLLMAARDSRGDGAGMSDSLLRDEGVTLLLAGHETTANALTWALWLLATHPDELALVRAEVAERIGDRTPTGGDVGSLPRMRAVIAETLRLFPPGPALSRCCIEPVTLPSGVELVAGDEVVVPVYATHRDPRWFPQPELFRPDRFADGMPPSGWPRHVWVPFGGGARICIGQAFAMMEMELVLAVLVRDLELEVLPGQEIRPDARFTVAPANGIMVSATPRAREHALT